MLRDPPVWLGKERNVRILFQQQRPRDTETTSVLSYSITREAPIHRPLVAQPYRTHLQETRVQSLGQEDSLEKEIATHSSTLAWEIPRTEKPGG